MTTSPEAFPRFADRRVYPRLSAERTCRVFRPSFNSFGSGRTQDYSAGGALVQVTTPRPIALGESLDVHIEFKLAAVLSAGSMIRATVLRVRPNADGTQLVAVKFDRALTSAAA